MCCIRATETLSFKKQPALPNEVSTMFGSVFIAKLNDTPLHPASYTPECFLTPALSCQCTGFMPLSWNRLVLEHAFILNTTEMTIGHSLPFKNCMGVMMSVLLMLWKSAIVFLYFIIAVTLTENHSIKCIYPSKQLGFLTHIVLCR